MTPLASLWLPILLAAAGVFIVSSIIHMATPWHQGDFGAVPDQARVLDALRSFNIQPGDYVVPRPSSRKEGASPEFAALAKRGPTVAMTVLPGEVVIAKSLVLWFVYCIVVALCAAYIAGAALPPAAAAKKVFSSPGPPRSSASRSRSGSRRSGTAGRGSRR
ncbi:MAG TPA: hypothetical protein VFD69_10065 [Vicinamibacterales bacterium]|nr:hypothetical protein [Vicinamibacterales bacterium]